MGIRGLTRFCMAGAAAGAIFAIEAAAQEVDDESLKLKPVTITATKRAEDLQDVSLSVSVLDQDALDVFGGAGDDIQFLTGRVPSLNIESSFGRIFPRPYIRGLGNTDFDFNASQPVSFIYDEVVFENPVLKGFPVFDLERVEVLRGPQGTLFGRNTPAGILKFDSVKPTKEFDAYGRVSYGRFQTAQIEGAVGGPINDWLSIRASGLFQRRSAFIDNLVLGPEGDAGNFADAAFRFQALIEPTDNFNWLLNLHGRRLRDGQVSFQANAFETGSSDPRPGFDRTESFADAGADSFLETDTLGLTSTANYDLGPVTATYVFGYEIVDAFSRGDVDGGALLPGLDSTIGLPDLEVPADVLFPFDGVPDGISVPGFIPFAAETADGIEDLDQITHEIRFSNTNPGRYDWTVGFYLFDEEITISSVNFDTVGGGVRSGFALQDQETDSFAVFGSMTYNISDNWRLAGGLRFTDDERVLVAQRTEGTFGGPTLDPITTEVGDTDVSWDVSVTYDQNDDISYYARVARGFRAPSIQGRVLFGDVVTTADSETLISYEGGVKSTLFDGRVRANLAGFFFDINDPQLTAIGGAGNFNQLLNAEAGVGYGFEADFDVLVTENLTVSANVSFNETEIQDEDLTSGICGAPCTVLDETIIAEDGTELALIDGNPFPQAPEWIANIVLNYDRPLFSGDMFFTTDWSFRSESNIFLYESVEFVAGGFVEGGVKMGYRQGPWEVSAFGRNITGATGTISAIDFNNLSGIFNQPAFWGIEAAWSLN